MLCGRRQEPGVRFRHKTDQQHGHELNLFPIPRDLLPRPTTTQVHGDGSTTATLSQPIQDVEGVLDPTFASQHPIWFTGETG